MKLFQRHSCKGQGSIEFTFALIAFLIMFFCVGDMLKIGFNWLGLQYAANRGARVVKMLPDETSFEEKANAIRNEMTKTAETLGINLSDGDIHITLVDNDTSINVEVQRDVILNPLSEFFRGFGGDHSGVYPLRLREVIRSESL